MTHHGLDVQVFGNQVDNIIEAFMRDIGEKNKTNIISFNTLIARIISQYKCVIYLSICAWNIEISAGVNIQKFLIMRLHISNTLKQFARKSRFGRINCQIVQCPPLDIGGGILRNGKSHIKLAAKFFKYFALKPYYKDW